MKKLRADKNWGMFATFRLETYFPISSTKPTKKSNVENYKLYLLFCVDTNLHMLFQGNVN